MKHLFVIACLLAITACSKSDSNGGDNALPTLMLNTPTNGQVFTGGSAVNITASISDDTRLAEVHVHISDQATGQLLIDIHRYPDAAAYSLNETFQVQSGLSYAINVIAIDRAGKSIGHKVVITAS